MGILEERLFRILELRQQGLEDIAIAGEIGLDVETIRQYGIEVRRKKRMQKVFSQRDKLIKQGLTLQGIAEKEGLTRERIRQYINERGLYEVWRKAREAEKDKPRQEKELRKNTIREILGLIEHSVVDRLVEEDRWAAGKSLEYLRSIKKKQSKNYNISELFTIFKRYDEARKNGYKLSLEGLGRGVRNMYSSEVGRVLKRVGLEALYGARVTIISENKERTKRSISIPIPLIDIAYFLGVNYNSFLQYLSRWNLNDKRPVANELIKGVCKHPLSYRLASQIYQAMDLGFNSQEIVELFDAKKKTVDYALAFREEVGPIIVNALQTLYPERKISKPYKDFKN